MLRVGGGPKTPQPSMGALPWLRRRFRGVRLQELGVCGVGRVDAPDTRENAKHPQPKDPEPCEP